MNHQKNYIGFANDHSQSMSNLRSAALKDYNANIAAVKEAASREMLDTIVSVFGFGAERNQVQRTIVNSNPHVLKPMTDWPAVANTPLYDALGDMITYFKSMPDYDNPNVSFFILATTDGEEYGSQRYTQQQIRAMITELQRTERWTFVFRVPVGSVDTVTPLGVYEGNIQQWDTSAKGMEASTAATAQAMNTYYAQRSAGKRGSSSFYTNANNVNVTVLKDISADVSLYIVPTADSGIQIRDFILRHRMEYLKGSAFYQLTKTEPRVSHTKLIIIRDRSNGKMYSGKDARSMIGLPDDRNARLHPGDHGNYDIFIQSESVNRKLVGGTGVLYWKAIGVPFTDDDLAYLQPKPVVPAAPAVVQLPAVAPTNKPTPSPLKPVKKADPVNDKTYFPTREEGRMVARKSGKSLKDAGKTSPRDQRWYIEV